MKSYVVTFKYSRLITAKTEGEAIYELLEAIKDTPLIKLHKDVTVEED